MTSIAQRTGNILLAVDGSSAARSTAYAAAKLAQALSWKIHALYIVDIADAFEIYTNIEQELSELGTEKPEDRRRITLLEEQGTLALEEIKGICERTSVPLSTEMMMGDIPSLILETAPKYDLLALGRRGNRHQKASRYLGNNFRKIAHHIEISMLIGAEDDALRQFQHLLLAYDGSELSRSALDWATALQTTFKERDILSVDEEDSTPEWAINRQQELRNSALQPFDFIRRTGKAGETIAATVTDLKADLLVMGGYRHSQLMEWATHSALDIVLRKSDLPVLAVK